MSVFEIKFDADPPYARGVGPDGHVYFDTREGLFQPRVLIMGQMGFVPRFPGLPGAQSLINAVNTWSLGSGPAGSDFMLGYFACSWTAGSPLEPYGATPVNAFVVPVGGSYMPVYEAGAVSGDAGPHHVASYSIVLVGTTVFLEERLNLPTLIGGQPYIGPSVTYRIYLGGFV